MVDGTLLGLDQAAFSVPIGQSPLFGFDLP